MTSDILQALLRWLKSYPDKYLDEMEMVTYIRTHCDVDVDPSTVSRARADAGWTKKVKRRVARLRNADLRDYYRYQILENSSYHIVFVDESGCDERVGTRRKGGLQSASRRSRSLASTVAAGTRSSRRTRKMA